MISIGYNGKISQKSYAISVILLLNLFLLIGGCGGGGDGDNDGGADNVGGNSSPTIANFAPASGQAGDTVTITGTNFSTTPGNNTVKFNGITAVV
ncbi:MAG: IPT/TIG domain-containing protein, partial [Deltaproteobacteria bacterium]|nr:IPT/TIG domain-containing protein [Deltaproteobacteria bacterium]